MKLRREMQASELHAANPAGKNLNKSLPRNPVSMLIVRPGDREKPEKFLCVRCAEINFALGVWGSSSPAFDLAFAIQVFSCRVAKLSHLDVVIHGRRHIRASSPQALCASTARVMVAWLPSSACPSVLACGRSAHVEADSF